jgi:carbamoyltransferase
MNILGISAYYHDSAAALIQDGQIIAAAQEERFSRIKNDKNFPEESIKFCLAEANILMPDLDAVVFYDKPMLKFERLLETYYSFAPKGIQSFFKSIPSWISDKIFIKKNIRKELQKIHSYSHQKVKLLFPEHHLSHAASAYYPSGFSDAAILTIDGVGEWSTATICKGSDDGIEVLKELHFPNSVGLFYSAFTYYLGFKVNSDEYKLMGLAPYGNSDSEETKKFYHLIKSTLIDIYEDGSIQMNQEYFSYGYGLRMLNDKKIAKLFGFKRRNTGEEIQQHQVNLAMAVQQITEEIVRKMVYHAKQLTQSENLCLAGGVALNCVINGKIQQEGIFEKIFIQPAAGDAGGAIGAALAAYHIHFKKPLTSTNGLDKMQGCYLGPSFDEKAIETFAISRNATYKKFNDLETLCNETASLITKGNIIGWFQGRMEFGPRALGNRSILADARNDEMQRMLNIKTKFREGFRPFAPAVLFEDAENYFELNGQSPYMLYVYPIKESIGTILPEGYQNFNLTEKLHTKRSILPAITHVDFTARTQTVSKETNPIFYMLLSAFKQQTGCPVIINTSFNIKDEPIVCTPENAYNCFLKTNIDYLVMGKYLFLKKDSPERV